MKKIALVGAALALSMAAGSALAANSMNTGTMGFNVNTSDNTMINGKYFIAKDMAVLGGFGLGINGGDAKGTDIELLAGVRKYMKTDDFAPFMGGRFADHCRCARVWADGQKGLLSPVFGIPAFFRIIHST